MRSSATPVAPPVRLDVRGHHCPIPVLKARRVLRDLQAGGLLDVWASDPAARIDMAHFCATEGHTLLEVEESAAGWRFLIRRGEPA